MLLFPSALLPFALALFLSVGCGAEQQQTDRSEEEEPVANEELLLGREDKQKLAPCDVFDPFKVVPAEGGHFQLGGAFPLHREDCLRLRPSSVQDVVAIQWTLAHWNEQKSESSASPEGRRRPKVGLFAGDSCTRPKEAILQSLRFLDSVGYLEPADCSPKTRTPERRPKLIGMFAPRDRQSADATAQVLLATVPVGAFSPASAQALADAGVRRFITTAPLFSDFVRVLVALIRMLQSDLVSIVDPGEDYALTPLLVDQLKSEGISVAEIIAFDHPMLPNILAISDAQIVVSLVPNRVLRETKLGELASLRELRKVWVGMELETEGLEAEEAADRPVDFLPAENEQMGSAKLQFISIRRHLRSLNEFNAYFLRVLVSNHAHYSLLRAYVQQVYGCADTTKANCSAELLAPERLAQLHRQSSSAEAAILLTYAFVRTAEKVQANEELLQKCSSNPSSAKCHEGIRAELLALSPDELGNVRLPPGFADKLAQMRFFETSEGHIQMAGIELEAILKETEGRDGGSLYRLLEHKTGPTSDGTTQRFALSPRLQQVRSRCHSYRPYCIGKCESATQRRDQRTFLSVPQQYALFVAAMFDLGGQNCAKQGANEDEGVALPLAFVHSMSTFRKQHSPQSALFSPAMDIGALLVDTCASGRDLLEFLVDSERNCYKFAQAERNWTVAAGATIGYVFGAEQAHSSEEGILRAMFSQPSESPVLKISDDQQSEGEKAAAGIEGLFAEGPTHRAIATGLAQFLKRMHWQYVNIVLDRSDANSVALFKQFERLSSVGICTADLVIVGKGRDAQEEEEGRKEDEQKQHKRSAGMREEQRRFGGLSANVTLVFASSKQAAEYVRAQLRGAEEAGPDGSGVPAVHIMVGDAHDFHLHDPVNLAQYAGTLSFQAKDVVPAEFRQWLQSVTPLSLPEAWFWRHVENHWHCSLFRDSIDRFHGRMCTGEERLDVKRMGRLTRAGYLAKGVHRLLSAVDRAHKRLCPSDEKLCEAFTREGRRLTREYLAKSAREEREQAFEMYEMVPVDHHGNFDYSLMANLSVVASSPSEGRFHLLAEYRPFAFGVPLSGDSATVVTRCRLPFCRCPTGKRDDSDVLGRSSYIRREPARVGDNADVDEGMALFAESDDPEVRQLGSAALDQESDWAIRLILLSLSALLTAIAVATLLLILAKIWRRTIRGSQSLGILLLLGIITMHASAFLFATNEWDNALICHLRVALPALAHSLCFGVVIVKAVQLRNAEALAGMGSAGLQISYCNYWLLLFFIFAVQVVICLRSLVADFLWPTAPSLAPPPFLFRCSHSSPAFLLAQVYTFLLLFLALLLSAQNRSIKRNYKEAKWLFVTSLVCTLILCAWAACHVLVSAPHLQYLTVLELHLVGSILLAFVFGPKLYVLLFFEPVVVQCAYEGGAGCDGKAVDLFEAEWAPVEEMRRQGSAHSPTVSSGGSCHGGSGNSAAKRMNSASTSAGEERPAEDERVSSAFQTILRKKTSVGSTNGAHRVQRSASGSAKGRGREVLCRLPSNT